MNYKKMIFAILCMSSAGLSLEAMEVPRTLRQIIQEDDVKTLRELLRTRDINPNEENIKLGLQAIISPLEYAVYHCSVQSVEFLLPFTKSDDLLLKAFEAAIRVRSMGLVAKGRDPMCRLQIRDLLLNKVNEIGLDIQPVLNNTLRQSFSTRYGPELVQFLLFLGADRIIRLPEGESLIAAAQAREKKALEVLRPWHGSEAYWTKQLRLARAIIKVLRTYAPDLQTRTALAILNHVREGKLTKTFFAQQQPSRNMIELIAKLASVDPEAEVAWIKIGMPTYADLLREAEEAAGPMELEECPEQEVIPMELE